MGMGNGEGCTTRDFIVSIVHLRLIKSRRLNWQTMKQDRMVEGRNCSEILTGKPTGKSTFIRTASNFLLSLLE